MALVEIERLEATLSQTLNAFVPPSQIDVVSPKGDTIVVALHEADSAAKVWPAGMAFPADLPSLPHTTNNAPIHAFTNELSRLLEELDGVDIRNDEGIRTRRKDVIRAVVEELEVTDEWIKRILSIYKYGNGANTSASNGSFARANYQTQLHLSLSRHAQYPIIFFDISIPPTMENVPVDVDALPNNQSLPEIFNSEATYPPLPHMTLTSERLPWTLEIINNDHNLVHVSDVLQCIYRSLQTPVAAEQLAGLDPGRSFHIQAAYRARCNRCQTPKEYEEEKKVGVRRIDFLLGRHIFGGLSAVFRHGTGTWVLHML